MNSMTPRMVEWAEKVLSRALVAQSSCSCLSLRRGWYVREPRFAGLRTMDGRGMVGIFVASILLVDVYWFGRLTEDRGTRSGGCMY